MPVAARNSPSDLPQEMVARALALLGVCAVASAYQPPVRMVAPRARVLASSVPRAGRLASSPSKQPKIAKGAGLSPSAVVIKENYSIAAMFLIPGPILMSQAMLAGNEGATFLAGFICTALGLVFAAQTMRVRFVLDKDDFRVMKSPLPASWGAKRGIEAAGDNVVVGGINKWRYSTFVNFGFFPKGFVEAGLPPILFYFKETQTPQKGASGPGKLLSDASRGFFRDAVPGQVHFAPAMCDCKELQEQLERKGAKRLDVW